MELPIEEEKLTRKLAVPSQGRLYYIRYAFKMGRSVEDVFALTNIDPWFLTQMKELVDFEGTPEEAQKHWAMRTEKPEVFAKVMRAAKERGYSDVQLATIWQTPLKWPGRCLPSSTMVSGGRSTTTSGSPA